MSKFYFHLLIVTFLISIISEAQSIVSGYITEKDSKEPISNVHIISEINQGTFSDIDGFFKLSLNEGKHRISFQHLAYKTQNKNIVLKANKPLELNIELDTKHEELETIVLSAGKFEQRLEDISVSLDVLDGDHIQNQHNYNVEKNIAQAPGLHIIDGQANIRGGSGWSYGAGSRVLVLLDGLPVTNSTTGAVQWELIPAENIERIEIIKGASSVLFGSSALNGVINITSKKAETKPRTTLSTYYGVYDKAKRASLNWWTPANIQPEHYGINFNHAQKHNNYSYNFGIQRHKTDGYMGLIDHTINDNDTVVKNLHIGEERLRIFFNTNIQSKRITGVEYGLNSAYLRMDESEGFLYLSDSLGYTPFSKENFSSLKSTQISISPNLTYNNSTNNTKHKLLGRYLQTNFNPDGTKDRNNYIALYSEYLFQKFYLNGTWTSGANLNYYVGLSDFFDSDQTGINYALFSQYDHTQGPLRYSIGARYEQYSLREKKEGKPVLRMGLNYELNERNFFRASIGQGYRYPSMFELFLYKDAGEISIYSNPELKPETGYTAEIGYKHKWISNEHLKTYIDLSAFYMTYNDMVEYSFGLWGDSTRLNPLGVGFKPINVGQTKISGLDFSLLADGRIGRWNLNSRLSYTYMVPKAVNPDAIYGNYNDGVRDLLGIDDSLSPEMVQFTHSELSYTSTSSNPESETLKYRYRHLAKFDLEISRNKWTIGTHLHYNSFMENVDWLFESGAFNAEVFDIFTLADANIADMGIKRSRERLNSGDFTADLRMSYLFTEDLSAQFIIENIFNREYQIRPASIGTPRLFSLKLTAQF
jgi:iron complex outermembrane receptor protein